MNEKIFYDMNILFPLANARFIYNITAIPALLSPIKHARYGCKNKLISSFKTTQAISNVWNIQ